MSEPQTGGVTLTWLGHATVLLELRGIRLLTDPLLRGRIAHLHRHAPVPEPPGKLDGVLLSHVHRDHFDVPSLRKLAAADVVLPRGAAPLVAACDFERVHEVAVGDHVDVHGLDVRAVPAWHEASRMPGGTVLDALGYLVEGVWFAGDTDVDEGMSELAGEVDVALVPVWGWGPSLGPGHMDPERAAQAVALVAAARRGPDPLGDLPPVRPGPQPCRAAARPAGRVRALRRPPPAPSTRVETLSVGGSLSL